MPEGLSDQDRAKIESARQSASGCLGVVSVVAFMLAAFVAVIGIIFMMFAAHLSSGFFAVAAIVTVIVVGILCLVARSYHWIGKSGS